MDKRDLKADLTRLDQIKKMNSPVKLAKFKEFFGEEWLNQALAEKERADKYEALVREQENQIDILSTTLAMYCSPYYSMQERAEKAEALVRESVVVLERMKFLSEEGFMIDETDDYALEQMINKAKEVLGDDANM